MKATGIVRRIDDLGRVVIPKEIRRTMRIREGEPLEIFTDKDGEVIFKKYSPIGEVGTFTGQFADAINKACGIPVAICDNDTVVAVSGVPKKDLLEKPISQTLYETMGRRQSYSATPDGTFSLEVAENSGSHVSFMSPIVAEGNVIGAVMSLQKQNGQSPDEAEKKLISTGAMFLSSQMEV
ncbi:MAG: AbrB/MazE/SpoVT family DNA-binding domain-containing protein [Clostridia bacterium]|nr:AbrB/MazE/SpoVT family DNA-binding domain-containing protein [Clostridia bacterium]MBQ7048589.1 AbrB/MazE/SpoVT family DNA-binding domain-containing protein [Clostridia bacterium]